MPMINSRHILKQAFPLLRKPQMLLTSNQSFIETKRFVSCQRYPYKDVNKEISIGTQSNITQLIYNRVSIPRNRLTGLTLRNSVSILQLRRNIHLTSVSKFQLSRKRDGPFYDNGKEPFSPPVKIYRISPFMLIVGSIVSMTLFLMIIPILFHFLFPIAIIAIVMYQFKGWKAKRFYHEIMRQLPTSEMTIRYKTLNSLQYRFIPSSLSKTFNVDPIEADYMMNMLQGRIIESFDNDESGICRYFFPGKDNVKVFDDVLKLDVTKFKTYGRKINDDLVMSMKYSLMYVEGGANDHFADVLISILDDSFRKQNSFKFIKDLAKTNERCKMVISIQAVGKLLPQQFILSTNGETGQFKVKRTADGHREFTIDKDN